MRIKDYELSEGLDEVKNDKHRAKMNYAANAISEAW
jgi:hypothetical protein